MVAVTIDDMKYGIIVGSHRKESQSTKVGKYVAERLKSVDVACNTEIFDLRLNPLPLWDESIWTGKGSLVDLWKPYSEQLKSCDAFVVIAPEWSGMVPAGLKNFFLYCKYELANKPAAIFGISSGSGGTYPVAELRMSSYKNTRICYIPEHIIITKVERKLNTVNLPKPKDEDFYIKKRIDFVLKVLSLYGGALKEVWNSEAIDFSEYPYGM
jgi:chromate reductase, NAD(P)H dehydrogenase (quinone)